MHVYIHIHTIKRACLNLSLVSSGPLEGGRGTATVTLVDCMYVYMYVCMHICVCVYVCTYVCVYVGVEQPQSRWLTVRIYAFMFVRTYVFTVTIVDCRYVCSACMYVCFVGICMYVCSYVRVNTCVCINLRIYACTHIPCMHSHIPTCMHTCIPHIRQPQ
jgi:hypothetical protein